MNQTPHPLWLLAEVTYRCPLHCAFGYNPVDFAQAGPELTTDEWLSVIRQARAMGAAQFGISGGEPMLRPDLLDIIRSVPAGMESSITTNGTLLAGLAADLACPHGLAGRLVERGVRHLAEAWI